MMEGITFVDRILLRFGLISPAAAMQKKKVATKVATLAELKKIPRYPPFMEGLPVCSPDELMSGQSDLLEALSDYINDETLLNEHYMPAIKQFAAFVHLLPASQTHHHRGAGGLLRHSLEVGVWGVRMTHGKLIRGVTAPQQRKIMEPRWHLAIFLAGLYHDIGKVKTDMSITDETNVEVWDPFKSGVFDWVQSHDITNYFIHWKEGRGKKHVTFSVPLSDRVIPEKSFSWLDENVDVSEWLLESLACTPGSTNQIHDYVVHADQGSVERDLKTLAVAMAGYDIGVPIERYLLDIMRRLVKEGLWRINESGARVWVIGDNTYLVWPKAGDEIAQKVVLDNIPGLPRTADGILDMMAERDIAMKSETGGSHFFFIAPDLLTEKIPDLKLKCIRLKDQALICLLPVSSIPGRIIDPDIEIENPAVPETITPASAAITEQLQPNTAAQSAMAIPQSPLKAVNAIPIDAIKPSLAPSKPVVPVAMAIEQLTGSMGALLKVLIKEFRSEEKSFAALATVHDHQLYLRWPLAFEGCGFSPKQILDGLTEKGWMEAMSPAAKVGDMQFASGMAKAICFTEAVSRIFMAELNKVAPQPAPIKPSAVKPSSRRELPPDLPPKPQKPVQAISPEDGVIARQRHPYSWSNGE